MLIRLREDDLREAGIPTKIETLRHWRKMRKYSEIFRKIGGTVYIETNKFEKLFK